MNIDLPFADRDEAGRLLVAGLSNYAGRDDLLVLGLPRGGIPIAYVVARALGAALDVLVVRKLGTPGREELAMGAIATGGARVMNPDVVNSQRISEEAIRRVAEREQRELERREEAYRGARPAPEIAGKCVIVVDDGLATGATMRAGVAALRQHNPARVVVAVPVAPPDAVARLREEADEVVCLATPESFFGVGQWYRDFTQVEDTRVRALLESAWSSKGQR